MCRRYEKLVIKPGNESDHFLMRVQYYYANALIMTSLKYVSQSVNNRVALNTVY